MRHHSFAQRAARFCGPALLIAAGSALACGHPATPAATLEQPADAGTTPEPADAGNTAPSAPSPVCSVDGWCWGTQSLQGNTLRAVAASSPRELWAVGALGLTLHFDGTRWSSHWAPLQETLRGVWLQGDELWAVGDRAQLLHFVAGAWQAVALPDVPASASLRGITGDDSGRMWVVGDGGLMFELRAGTWSRVDVGTAVALNAVWAGRDEAWAVGDGGTVLHLENDAWTRVDAGTTRKL